MITTVLKGNYIKLGPNIIHYRNYSNFNAEEFGKDLKHELLNFQVEQTIVRLIM